MDMNLKTTRDIKSSLELGRQQTVPSRTRFIEDKIKKELADEFSDILNEGERRVIEEKEIRRIEAHDRALKGSKMKILRAKEKARVMQEMRSGIGTRRKSRVNRAKGITKSKPLRKKNINEISLEY